MANPRALYAYNYYINKGLPPHVAAGFVGNFNVESGFADDVLSGRRAGDNGTAFGLAQWRGDRLANLNKYSAQRGMDWRKSLDTQLDFALEEFNPQSPFRDQIAANNYQRLLQTQNPSQAANLIMNKFERAHPSPEMNHIARRVEFANQIAGTPYNAVASAPTGIDMPTQATMPQGTAAAMDQAVAQQLAQVQAARAAQLNSAALPQAATQAITPAPDPFAGFLQMMSMAQQKPTQTTVMQDAITPPASTMPQEPVDPEQQLAMVSHTPNVYFNRLRRRIA